MSGNRMTNEEDVPTCSNIQNKTNQLWSGDHEYGNEHTRTEKMKQKEKASGLRRLRKRINQQSGCRTRLVHRGDEGTKRTNIQAG